MGSKVISFRFNDAELEALQALQTQDDDSLNQTAARLLRGLLGASTASTVSMSTVSTSVDIQELIQQELSKALANSEQLKEMISANTAYLATGINEIKREVDERLGELSA